MRLFSGSSVQQPPFQKKEDGESSSFMRRLSFGKSRLSFNLERNSSTAKLASRSAVSLALPSGEERSSRRAFDLFSSGSARPFNEQSPTPGVLRSGFTVPAPSSPTRSSRRSTPSRFKKEPIPPVPAIHKAYLISDQLFIIKASDQSLATPVLSPATPSSSSLNSSMLSSPSSGSSGSWLDSLGDVAPDEVPTFPEPEEEPLPAFATSVGARTSLDDIDDQMLLNLCDTDPPKGKSTIRSTRSGSGASTPRPVHERSRSADEKKTQPVVPPKAPRRSNSSSHCRTASAPQSLGALPPPPTQAPSEAVLRRTEHFKKRYSRQGPSPVSLPLLELGEDQAFLTPRAAPATPKLDRMSELNRLEKSLSKDSMLAKRNHKRSMSKSSHQSYDSAFVLTEVKLTPGHVASPRAQVEADLVFKCCGSRASSDAESPASHRSSGISGSRIPEIVATRSSSSSSSSSCYSELSEMASTIVDETMFDLSRKSLDYRTVYALAQEYAKSNNAINKLPETGKPKKNLPSVPSKGSGKLNIWSRNQRQMPDPVDRSYHLRKF